MNHADLEGVCKQCQPGLTQIIEGFRSLTLRGQT